MRHRLPTHPALGVVRLENPLQNALLLSAVFGILGSLLTLWISLGHDRRQKKKERAYAARREVFLKAAEGAAAVREFIYSYVGGRSRTDWKGTWQTAPGWLEKIMIVGDEKTIRAFLEAAKVADKAVAELELLQSQIDNKELERKSLEASRDALLQIQKTGGNNAIVGPAGMDPHIYAFVQQMTENWDRSRRVLDESRALHDNLARRCVALGDEYTKALNGAIGEVRRELDFPNIETLLEEISSTQDKDVKDAMEELLTNRGPFAEVKEKPGEPAK